MQVGKRIYYDLTTGNVLVDTRERRGYIVVTTIENDIATYRVLSERNRDTFDVIELEYGAYSQDFSESDGYQVNTKTKELEFSYPDPDEPEIEQPYQASLSEQVSSNMDYLLDVDFRLLMVELGMY